MADDPQASPVGRTVARVGAGAGLFTQYAGAVLSLALVAGVGVWGYKLLVRDVTGIPVVRAMEGPMREAPANPGGEVAAHTGLAVNTVAAVGAAAPPEDRLVLAPPHMELAPEDMEAPREAASGVDDGGLPVAQGTTLADAVMPTAAQPSAEPAPLTEEEVLALADQIAAGLTATPDSSGALAGATGGAVTENFADGDVTSAPEILPEPAEAVSAAPVSAGIFDDEVEAEAFAGRVAPSVPGVSRSLRPSLRPTASFAAIIATSTPAQAADVAAARAPVAPVAVRAEPIPLGTNLVQLGAFDSPEIAGQEWERLRGRFSAFLAGKERVIQEASSGGRTFYRLRALGFADLGDARRFCSALVAENAACIPVVVR